MSNTIRRKSTVHDLASLRLHPDGSRVQQSSTNAKLRTAKYAVKDSRGNWIARDAGGLESVKKRTANGNMGGREDEEFSDIDGRKDGERERERTAEVDGDGGEQPAESSTKLLRDARAKKRQKFNQDFDYITSRSQSKAKIPTSHINSSPDTHSPEKPSNEQVDKTSPAPSSDLLKCIHHFASCYYSDNSQLFDGSREYRRKKQKRRLLRLSQGSPFKRSAFPANEGHESGPADENFGEGTSGDSDDEHEIDGHRSRRTKNYQKDMYKVFDGSALVAIGWTTLCVIKHVVRLMQMPGMLLQEYVARAVEPDLVETSSTTETPIETKQRNR